MKHKTKTKNLQEFTQDASCHDNSGKQDQGQPQEGVRRSTRKRSAPKTFVVTSKKLKGLYWGTTEKEKLLKVLQELNSQQLSTALYYSKNRYPIKLIQRTIGTKSMDDVKKYLASLERQAAGMTLSQMKHQAPLQSWCKMADKLTILTSDSCARQLIRVCSILALESHDDEQESTVTECDVHEKRNIPTSSVTPKTSSSSEDTEATSGVSPGLSSSVTNAAAEAKPMSTRDSTSSTETSQDISLTSPTQDDISRTAQTTETSDNSTTAIRDGSSTKIPTATAATTERCSKSANATLSTTTRDISSTKTKPKEMNQLELNPDYPAIYKYFGNLMQGEQKELGQLESLVVLDCLKTVEKHLVARDNTKQKKFTQNRFLDILENLYLSIDGETARKSGGTMNEDHDAGNAVTMEDLLGINNQSQSRKCAPDQSKTTSSENGQSASSSCVGPSTSSMLQGQSPSSKQIPTRLGSLNPFGIPVQLLEIRRDR